uniref:Ground-like domain-containing protein n=1 Tax=Thelazia callipaeda TaxID=103827 RepID=A0A0N5CP69_THECL
LQIETLFQYANDNNTRTKVEIQRAAQQLLGGLFGVICGSDDFAYIIQTNDFCQHRTANTTCYVFRSKMIY